MEELALELTQATDEQIRAACMTRGDTDAVAHLAAHGLFASISRCEKVIGQMIEEGVRGKLSMRAGEARDHAEQAAAAMGCRNLLRRQLETGAHWISDPMRMRAALAEAGL